MEEKSGANCFWLFLFSRKLRCISDKAKKLRVDCTAAEQNLSLRDPPQAENPAPQDSIFIVFRKKQRPEHIPNIKKRFCPDSCLLLLTL